MSMELNELVEGDLMYLQHFSYVKEEVCVSSDKFAFLEDANCSDIGITDNDDDTNTNKQFQNIKNEMEIGEEEAICDDTNLINSDTTSDATNGEKASNQNTLQAVNASERLITTSEFGFEDTNTHKNISQMSMRKVRFSSKNLIDLYCYNCDNVTKRLWGEKRSECKQCTVSLQYQCAMCNKRYKTYQDAFLHVKHVCSQAFLLRCSACYFETLSKENLDNHVRSRHIIQECLDCGKKFESNQMKRHQLFECKSWNSPRNKDDTVNIELNTSDNVGVSGSTKKKQNKNNDDLLLELYCNSCDRTVEKVKDKALKICNDCRSLLLYECIMCCKRYSTVLSGYNHIKTCNRLFDFRCNECGFQTAYKVSLLSHIDRKHRFQECTECNAICENSRSLMKHEKYECESNPRFRGHRSKIKKVSGQSKGRFRSVNSLKFYCPNCRASSQRSRSDRPPPCSVCGGRLRVQCAKCDSHFGSFASAYRHAKSDCSRDATSAAGTSRRRASRGARGRRVECPDCGKRVKPHSMYAHRKHCNLLPNVRCAHCAFRTKYPRNLTAHLSNLHADLEVQGAAAAAGRACGSHACPKCAKKFKHRHNIVRHLKVSCPSGDLA